jgi:predicted Zn-dependent peptidase
VPLLSEVLWEPAFSPEEVRRERDQILAEIRLRDDDPMAFTYRHFRRALYGNHPYGHPVEGAPESVERLTTGLCRQWHRRLFAAPATLLVAVGHFEPKTLVRLLNRHFGKRTAPGESPPGERLRAMTTHRPRRTALTRRLEQSICLIGWPAPSVESIEDAAAMKVGAAVLGAGMSSRLFQELRDKQGLAYSVGCSFSLRRSTSHLLAHIGTKPESATPATRAIVKEIQALGREPVPDNELERAKTYLKGNHLSDHQTNARQAWHLGWGQLTGLGHDFDARWPAMIDAVAPEDIMRVIRRHVRTPTIVTLRPRGPGRG